jgi:ABC-type multidrug transport system fused ATPase/permease subunit
MEDLSDLRENEEPKYSAETFTNIFYGLNPTEASRLLTSFKKYLGVTFVLGGIFATIANLLQFAGPFTINKILEFLNSPDNNKDIGEGFLWVSILIGCYLLRTIIFQHAMHFVNLSCTKVLNSANSLLYNKILKLSSSSRKYLEVGAIMNNVNVDIQTFYFFIMMSTFVFSAPCMIFTAIIMLVLEVGWIGLVAPLLFFIGMGVQQKMMKMAI